MQIRWVLHNATTMTQFHLMYRFIYYSVLSYSLLEYSSLTSANENYEEKGSYFLIKFLI